MENASKALLIAAAVLVVILIIAFGMRVMNSSQQAGDQAGQAATQIQQGAEAGVTSINAALQQTLQATN